jgi:hypothetical protein
MQRLYEFMDVDGIPPQRIFIRYQNQRAEKNIILDKNNEGMSELLTEEEIKASYDGLLNKSGYIETLKHNFTEIKREQVLNYAKEVYREASIRIERENSVFHPIMPYNFPPSPLSTDLVILPNGIKLDTFTYQDQLKYWRVTSERAIKLLEDSMKPFQGSEKAPRTFKTNYINTQLNIIRERLINAKIIENISENDFIYLFTEKPVNKGMVSIKWKESLSLCHEFLRRVVYAGVEFDLKQVNDCISFPGGKKLDSNNKSTALYKNDDILNPVLKF